MTHSRNSYFNVWWRCFNRTSWDFLFTIIILTLDLNYVKSKKNKESHKKGGTYISRCSIVHRLKQNKIIVSWALVIDKIQIILISECGYNFIHVWPMLYKIVDWLIGTLLVNPFHTTIFYCLIPSVNVLFLDP
jgi:hypothetical protein